MGDYGFCDIWTSINLQRIADSDSMKNPVHSGHIIQRDCLDSLNLSLEVAAARLGVECSHLSELVEARCPLSPEMAIRLEKLGWGRADAWIRLQSNVDIAAIRAVQDEIVVNPRGDA